MSVHEHKANAPQSVRVALVTLSDTRTEATDKSGQAAHELVARAGHTVGSYRILRDEPSDVVAHVKTLCASGSVDAIITSGGTGLSSRDRTYEALSSLFERELRGFGELFRMLSYGEIGSAAMLSRATAGLFRGVAIFACPGSEAALRLAMEKLILPELPHIVREIRR